MQKHASQFKPISKERKSNIKLRTSERDRNEINNCSESRKGKEVLRLETQGEIILMFLTILLYFYTHPSLYRKILQLSSLNQMYEERTQATIYTSSYSSKALILYDITRVSIEVQEYRSIVRNDGND